MSDESRARVADPEPGVRWGFMEDGEGGPVFTPVPKAPLILQGLMPPVTVQLYAGPRQIIRDPQS